MTLPWKGPFKIGKPKIFTSEMPLFRTLLELLPKGSRKVCEIDYMKMIGRIFMWPRIAVFVCKAMPISFIALKHLMNYASYSTFLIKVKYQSESCVI